MLTRLIVFLCLWCAVDGSSILEQPLVGSIDPDACLATTDDPADEATSCMDETTSETTAEIPSPAMSVVADSGADFGVAQAIDIYLSDQVYSRIGHARRYVEDVVWQDPKYRKVRASCRNQHENCAFWAIKGECESNPGYMTLNCAPVCETCDQLHIETRCPMDPNAVDALYPGDLNRVFEDLMANPEYAKYNPTALSGPNLGNGTVDGPWLIQLDNFLTDAEADRIIELGQLQGYARSEDVGEQRADGTYTSRSHEGRTSTNAWCQDQCYQEVKPILDRIANITQTPEVNAEFLQLLQYSYSQFYETHNDYIPHQRDRPCGARIYTFYMYLSDVEDGGGTNFPALGLTVQPKKGRAVLWPSVLDEDPNRKDLRTNHQALPVVKGIKYGANAWIHQRDFKTPHKTGCV